MTLSSFMEISPFDKTRKTYIDIFSATHGVTSGEIPKRNDLSRLDIVVFTLLGKFLNISQVVLHSMENVTDRNDLRKNALKIREVIFYSMQIRS